MSAGAQRPARGRLLAIEGIDGTGKSTLAAALAEALRRRGEDVVLDFEPTRGPHGLKARALGVSGREGVTPEQETELFLLDRREHVERVIAPALAAGRVVVLDRYFYSTMAYQGARGMDPAAIRRANAAFAPEADFLILLDLPVADALDRVVSKRGSTPDHFEGEAYLARAREIFLAIEHPRRILLDARKTTGALVAEILSALDSRH